MFKEYLIAIASVFVYWLCGPIAGMLILVFLADPLKLLDPFAEPFSDFF